MIADVHWFSEHDVDDEYSACGESPPTRPEVALGRKREIPSRQRRANLARFRRGSARAFNGAHRRRDKRSYL